MKKGNTVTTISKVEVLVSIAWILIVLLYGQIDDPGFYIWGGVVFALIAFVLTFLGMYYFSSYIFKTAVEIVVVPYYFLTLFYFASVLSNTIFAFRYDGESNRFVLVWNIILYVVYGATLLYANTYVSHMAEVSQVLETKVTRNDNHRMNLSNLIVIAKDPDEQAKLKALKELVDYSSNIATPMAEENERLFIQKLNEIYSLISTNGDKQQVLAAIEQATDIWKCRNAAIMNR